MLQLTRTLILPQFQSKEEAFLKFEAESISPRITLKPKREKYSKRNRSSNRASIQARALILARLIPIMPAEEILENRKWF